MSRARLVPFAGRAATPRRSAGAREPSNEGILGLRGALTISAPSGLGELEWTRCPSEVAGWRFFYRSWKTLRLALAEAAFA
jgi:hypothetical protein